KYIISNSSQNLIRKLVMKQPTIDYKLLSGYNNCFNDVHLNFSEGNADFIFKDFIPQDFV
ncbi:hypothetical protein SNEBB_005213, partial [Seison nebaliae]